MDRWGATVMETDLQLSLFVAKSSERIIKLTVELQYRPHIFHVVQYNRCTQNTMTTTSHN